MVYSHTGIAFNPKKESGVDTCYNVDEPQGRGLQRNSEPGTYISLREVYDCYHTEKVTRFTLDANYRMLEPKGVSAEISWDQACR